MVVASAREMPTVCQHFPNSRGLQSVPTLYCVHYGHGHRGILGTKPGASAGGSRAANHWRTGTLANWASSNLPAALESDMPATCQASISGVIHETSPKHAEFCRTRQSMLPPERESEPSKIHALDGPAWRSLELEDMLVSRFDALCLQCARKGVLVLLVYCTDSRMLTAGQDRTCRSAVGDGAQWFRKLIKWMDHGETMGMIIICRRNVRDPQRHR